MKLFLFEDRAVEKAIFHSILVEIVEGCLDNKGIFIFNVFLISSLFLPESFWFRKKKFEESRELILRNGKITFTITNVVMIRSLQNHTNSKRLRMCH